MEYFNHAYIEVSYRARDLQHLLGWPSYQQLINNLSNNFLIDFPVLLDDVRRAHAIYGPDTATLRRGCWGIIPNILNSNNVFPSKQKFWITIQNYHSIWIFIRQRTSIFSHNRREGELQDNQAIPRLRQEIYPEDDAIHSYPEHQEGFPGKWVSCRQWIQ